MARYLTVKMVAALFNISTKTVYKKKKEIPGYFNMAGLHYFDEEILTQSIKELAFNPIKQIKTKVSTVRKDKNRHGLFS